MNFKIRDFRTVETRQTYQTQHRLSLIAFNNKMLERIKKGSNINYLIKLIEIIIILSSVNNNEFDPSKKCFVIMCICIYLR